MRFEKMHGLGNDFIMLDDSNNTLCDCSALAKRLCDRRTGIGADGLILVRKSDVADVRMSIFNSDGSEAEMCGNGIRCFARYARDLGLTPRDSFSVETLAGIMKAVVASDSPFACTVNMGEPHFERDAIPMPGSGVCRLEKLTALDREFTYSAILLGVPHAVIFVDDVSFELAEKYGAAIEHYPAFLNRANANFAHVVDRNTVEVRTWERGCGVTLACGTGSSSVAVCCADAGLTERSVDIRLALGMLHIDWAEDGCVYMTGPAEYAFSGDVTI